MMVDGVDVMMTKHEDSEDSEDFSENVRGAGRDSDDYHRQDPTRTKMTNEDDAKAFFQLFNNAKDFLEKHFDRTGHM